jgi:NAD-dependent SIR2 family protein deacetylase
MAYDKNVYILGAGASADAGAPLMWNFLRKARELLDNPKSGLSQDARERFQRVFEYRASLYPALRKIKIDLDNIEELFGLVDMAKQFGDEEADAMRKDLIYLIACTLEKLILLEYSKGVIHPSDTYSRFAKMLSETWKKWWTSSDVAKRDSIITFNYDVALDHALSFHELGYTYGLPSSKSHLDMHLLLKLHGSLNWGICEQCGNIQEVGLIPPGYIDKLRLIAGSEKQKVDFSPSSIVYQTKCSKCDKGDTEETLTPLIVPPTWNKGDYHRHVQPVWEHALKELRSAYRIIIIGYSMPETDTFFKHLLVLALAENEEIQELIVINPAKDETLRNRYQQFMAPFFDTNNFTFWDLDFALGIEALITKRNQPNLTNQEIQESFHRQS